MEYNVFTVIFETKKRLKCIEKELIRRYNRMKLKDVGAVFNFEYEYMEKYFDVEFFISVDDRGITHINYKYEKLEMI